MRQKYYTDKKKKKDDCNEEDSVPAIEMNLSSLSTVSFDPWEHVLACRGVLLWVWCRDCRKAQEMNVLSAHARKTRLRRGRRNKYLNLTHLFLPSQTKQAVDSFLSSNKTRFDFH